MKLCTSKKVLIASFLFATTTSLAFSANNYKGYKDEVPCPPIPTLKDGFYVGIQGGYDSYGVKQTDSDGTATATTTINPTGWVGGLFAGYGMDFHNMFYLGAEGFVNGSAANETNSFTDSAAGVSGSQKINAGLSYGLALLPGIKFTPSTLVYVRLGYNWSSLKVTESLSGTGDDYSASATHTFNGFAYGLGVETLVPQISDHLSIRAEYTYTGYGSYRPDGGDIKFAPSDNQFMFGVIYHI